MSKIFTLIQYLLFTCTFLRNWRFKNRDKCRKIQPFFETRRNSLINVSYQETFSSHSPKSTSHHLKSLYDKLKFWFSYLLSGTTEISIRIKSFKEFSHLWSGTEIPSFWHQFGLCMIWTGWTFDQNYFFLLLFSFLTIRVWRSLQFLVKSRWFQIDCVTGIGSRPKVRRNNTFVHNDLRSNFFWTFCCHSKHVRYTGYHWGSMVIYRLHIYFSCLTYKQNFNF